MSLHHIETDVDRICQWQNGLIQLDHITNTGLGKVQKFQKSKIKLDRAHGMAVCHGSVRPLVGLFLGGCHNSLGFSHSNPNS